MATGGCGRRSRRRFGRVKVPSRMRLSDLETRRSVVRARILAPSTPYAREFRRRCGCGVWSSCERSQQIEMKKAEQAEAQVVALLSARQRDVAARQSVSEDARGDNWKALPGFATVGFMELRDGVCRWPINTLNGAASYRYCGRRCAHEGSYCETHRTIASVAIRPRSAPHRRDASAPAIAIA